MSLKILVTGGAGYLGSIMVPALLNEGHQVTVVDNFMYQQNSLASICRNSKFSVVNSDVRIESNLYPLLNKADAIIPLAALVGAPLCDKDPVTATTVNKESVLKMLKHISKNQWVIMPTTNSAYGTGDKNNHCDENSPLNPISLYAKDKVMVEKELMERENSISYRLATVFGMSPRMRIDLLVNDFTYRAMTDRAVVLFESGFKRNYIHNFDVTRAFIHGLNHFSKMKGQVYNVGLSEANLSKKELCLAIQKHIPAFSFVESQIGKDPDQRNYIVSNKKIEATGFKTAVTLDDGIQELIKGYTMIRNARYGNV